MKLPKNYWIGIVLVLLVTTWLGARRLNADGMWFDEWWSQYVAGADTFNVPRTVEGIWHRIVTENIREGAFYPMTLAVWGSLVGWTEFATRALSLFGGLIAVAGVFRLGITLSHRPMVGLSTAALMGTSLWFITFTHEMRNYIFMVMFTVLMLLVYQRIMMQRSEPRLWHYAALGVITGLLIHTHYFGCLVVAALGVWHLTQLAKARPTRRWWSVIGAWIGSLIIIIPWLINLPTAATLAANEPRVTPNISVLLEVFRDTIYTFSNGSIALYAVLLAFSLRALRTLRGARWVWALALMLIPLNLAAYYLFSLNEPRYSLAMLPLLALLGGYGVYELERRRVPALAIIAVWAAGFFAVESSFSVERMLQRWPGAPIREMAGVLQGRVIPTDVIINLLGSEDRPTLVHTPLVHYMGNLGARIEVVENSTFPATQIFAQRVRDAVGDADRVWMLNDPRWELEERGLFEYVMNEQNLYRCGTLANTSNMLIEGFGRIRNNAPAWDFGGGIEMSLMDTPRITHGALQVWLAYQISEHRIGDPTPLGIYSTALHLTDQAGELLAQNDRGFPGTGMSCEYIEIPLSDLPAGDYQLHLAVYNWQTGERKPSITPDGETTDYPHIASVRLP